jgi:hypothetical protein
MDILGFVASVAEEGFWGFFIGAPGASSIGNGIIGTGGF